MRTLYMTGFAACLLLCVGGAEPKADADKNIIRPIVVLSGTDSTVMKDGFYRITTKADWQKLWEQHRRGDAPIRLNQYMTVDFEKNMVIAIFRGDCGYYGSIWPEAIKDEKDFIRVQFVISTVQLARGGKSEKVEPIQYEAGSYGFFVLPRSNKPIKFEIGFKRLIADPYTWKADGELPELK